MVKAAGQAFHVITAEPASVVHVKSRYFQKKMVSKPPNFKNKNSAKNSVGILPTPPAKGIVIHDTPFSAAKLKLDDKLPPPPRFRKGKGKLVIAHPCQSDDDDSSNDEAGSLPSLV